MPWITRKDGKRWAIIRKDSGEVVGHSSSLEKAKSSIRARYAKMSAVDRKRHGRV